MNKTIQAVGTAASLAALLALAACGERPATDNGLPQASSGPVTEERAAQDATAAREPDNVDTTILGGPPAAGAEDDAQLAQRVQSALASDPDLGALNIEVQSEGGVVTLRGAAPDAAAKERAAELARSLPDVKSVENQLTLG